jgi:hypothetical protein
METRDANRLLCRALNLILLICLAPLTAVAGNDPIPPEQLVGKWRDAKNVIVTIDQNADGKFTLTRDNITWEQVGSYSPGPKSTLEFKYKPTADQIPDSVTDQNKKKLPVTGEDKQAALEKGLEWRTKFTDIETGYRALGNTCKLFMEGEFLPGDIVIDEITDKDTGQVTHKLKSATVGGPSKPIKVKQVQYYLPDMGDWLTINARIDEAATVAGLGQIASLPSESQAYTYLGNLDAAILEGMYQGLTFAAPLEGVGKYGVKLIKGVAKGKLEGKDASQAAVETMGKMLAGEILKGMMPKDRLSEFMQGVADTVRDKVADKIGKKGAEPVNEKLFDGEQDRKLKSYFSQKCRFQFVQLPNYSPNTFAVSMAIVDTKLGTAHFIFMSPPRDLKSGGHFGGAVLVGDINLPEADTKPKATQLELTQINMEL